MMPRNSLIPAVWASIFCLTACSTSLRTNNEKLADLNVPSPAPSNKTQTTTTISGERYDPTVDEAVANGTRAAWQVAIKHDKKGELPDNDWLKLRLADEKESMRQLLELEKTYPNASFIKTMKGQVAQHFGKKENAAQFYEEAMFHNRHDPLLTFKLAETKRSAGHFEKAAAYYRDVIKIQPDFIPAQIGLAQCLMQSQETKPKGQEILKELADKYPENKEIKALLLKK